MDQVAAQIFVTIRQKVVDTELAIFSVVDKE